MKKIAAVLLGAGLLVSMSGCAVDTEDKIRERAEFIKICKDHGGEPWNNAFNVMQCDMESAMERDDD